MQEYGGGDGGASQDNPKIRQCHYPPEKKKQHLTHCKNKPEVSAKLERCNVTAVYGYPTSGTRISYIK